jgi:hypothetical protein
MKLKLYTPETMPEITVNAIQDAAEEIFLDGHSAGMVLDVTEYAKDPNRVELLYLLGFLSIPCGAAGVVSALLQHWNYPVLVLSLAVPAALFTSASIQRKAGWTDDVLEIMARKQVGPLALPALIRGLQSDNRRIVHICSRVATQILNVMDVQDFRSLDDTSKEQMYSFITCCGSVHARERQDLLAAVERLAGYELIPSLQSILAHRPGFKTELKRLHRCANEMLIALMDRQRKEHEEHATDPANLALKSDTPASKRSNEGDEFKAVLELRETAGKRPSPAMRLDYLLMNWLIVTPYMAYQTYLSYAARGLSPITWVLGGLTLTSTMLYRLVLLPAQTRKLEKAVKLGDARAAGVLTEALTWPDPGAVVLARSALTKILNEITGDDTAALTRDQRRILDAVLVDETDQNYFTKLLRLAILRAWKQIGDETSLPVVRRLASTQTTDKNRQELVLAAQECLPFLEEVAKKNEQGQVLLRAASLSGNPDLARDLVRPAVDNYPAEELLRSTAGDSDQSK